MTGFVYFVHAEQVGRIKIGFAHHVGKRLAKMQTDSPVALFLIGQFPGTEEDEAATHERFARYRQIGEWFDAAQDVISFAKQFPVPRKAERPLNCYAQARQKLGLRQDQLAEAVRKTQGTISRWENGTMVPRYDDILTMIGLGTERGVDLRPVLMGAA